MDIKMITDKHSTKQNEKSANSKGIFASIVSKSEVNLFNILPVKCGIPIDTESKIS